MPGLNCVRFSQEPWAFPSSQKEENSDDMRGKVHNEVDEPKRRGDIHNGFLELVLVLEGGEVVECVHDKVESSGRVNLLLNVCFSHLNKTNWF